MLSAAGSFTNHNWFMNDELVHVKIQRRMAKI